ncbi:hypothetical protein DFH06DRAFT_1386099 [Mycena polygramma]|nr:hypothetical protein DFH06DRAFT_1386099 [Mycena polygramma]
MATCLLLLASFLLCSVPAEAQQGLLCLCPATTLNNNNGLYTYTSIPNGVLHCVYLVPVSGATVCNNCQCPAGYTSTSRTKLTKVIQANSGCVPICAAGQYRQNDGSCGTCAAGTYSSTGDVTSCTPCGLNAISSAGSSSCTSCPAGSSANADSTACGYRICPAGQFANGNACTPCAAGTYSSGGTASGKSEVTIKTLRDADRHDRPNNFIVVKALIVLGDPQVVVEKEFIREKKLYSVVLRQQLEDGCEEKSWELEDGLKWLEDDWADLKQGLSLRVRDCAGMWAWRRKHNGTEVTKRAHGERSRLCLQSRGAVVADKTGLKSCIARWWRRSDEDLRSGMSEGDAGMVRYSQGPKHEGRGQAEPRGRQGEMGRDGWKGRKTTTDDVATSLFGVAVDRRCS